MGVLDVTRYDQAPHKNTSTTHAIRRGHSSCLLVFLFLKIGRFCYKSNSPKCHLKHCVFHNDDTNIQIITLSTKNYFNLFYAKLWLKYYLVLALIAQQVAVYLYLLGVAHLLAHDIRELHAELLGLAGVDLARRQLHHDIARGVACVAR